MSTSRLWQRILPGIAVFATLIVVVALLFTNRGGSSTERGQQASERAAEAGQQLGKADSDPSEESEADSRQMGERLAENPGLSNRQLPLAFVTEKLEGQGGEATGEIVNGPSQEQYDQRAYPHVYITPEQQSAAARAAVQATVRAETQAGQALLRKAQGTAAAQTWKSLGPRGGVQLPVVGYTGTRSIVSGRTTSLAIAKSCTRSRCTLYAGTAGGGVWKTTNAMAATPKWSPIGSDIPSNAIGVVYLARNGDLYVGTGEPNGSGDSEAGVGLFKSTNHGKTFARVPTRAYGANFTLNRSISSVAIDPKNGNHMYIGTAVARHGLSSVQGGRFTPPGAAKVGVYETYDGGHSWRLTLSRISDVVDPSTPTGTDYFRGGITKILFDPTHPRTVYASMFDYGLFRRVEGRPWRPIYTINTPGDPATGVSSRIEFALNTLPNGHTRIYLGDATYFENSVSGLLRSDNGTALHPSWTLLSDPEQGTPGYGSYNFCHAQCSYDMVVASPHGRPNQVFLSGSMNYYELQVFGGPGNSNGRAVVRSADSGRHFTDMTNDAQPKPNGLHPDHHALVFAPHSGATIFFTASDGGVVRQRGPFVDRSGQCRQRGLSGALLRDCRQFLSAIPKLNRPVNKGLATLQYQSLSVAKSGRVLQAGTQDNGTWESDTEIGWAETVGGDGGQSGFNADYPRIRYHSYYAPQHDVNFHGGNPTGWDFIADPLLASGESASFYVPLTADPVVAGTIFDGLQHIWRTPDNGGKHAFLDKHCNELTGDFSRTCGDWVPLGGAKGNLSSGLWGHYGATPDNYVVAIERAPSDRSTMWAATRFGRVFISSNANAKDADAVTYQRLDAKLGLPRRFVSGIAIDPKNPNHVFISYSGYSAYSTGGHVYEVRWNPKTEKGTARNLSFDLRDQPVTDIVYAATTGALFISTDFGVLTRVKGGDSWVATRGLPRVAVYGLTLDRSSQQLFAATHGRSIWKLRVR